MLEIKKLEKKLQSNNQLEIMLEPILEYINYKIEKNEIESLCSHFIEVME